MLRLQNISKSFGAVKAVQDVSMQFHAGEVHALCGENGAGKSTLMALIAGNLQPDDGKIFLKDEPQLFQNRMQSAAQGIAIVYQERSLVPSLSIAENIFPTAPPRNHWGLIDYPNLYAQAAVLLQQLGLQNLSPKTLVKFLSPPQQSLVEIAKALATNPQLLILDEPTASLTHHETQLLFNIIKNEKRKGTAIIYITHRMKELDAIADVVSVMKDGKYQGTFDAAAISPQELVKLMVGRDLQRLEHSSNPHGAKVLEVQHLSGTGFADCSFDICAGEIFGLAGLVGSGRTAIALALFGDVPAYSGTVLLNGKKVALQHPADAIAEGIAYVPDDRKTEGLFLDFSITQNIAATHLNGSRYKAWAFEKVAHDMQQQLDIRTPSVAQPVRSLSGGNQQKVVLARWLQHKPELLIVNEPTHGVDVGAKQEIYGLLKKFTNAGKSVLLISSDLPELLLLSNRIGVVHEGKLKAIVPRDAATEAHLMQLASGL